MSKEHTGLPNTPEEIRAFIGKSFSSLQFGQDNELPHENDTYTLTAHDLISAFQWAEIDAPMSAEPTDDEIIDIAVEPLGIDCDRMPYGVVVFARALLSRYSSAPVVTQPDVTQQTLDDVMAGIPARDAEIEALRKEIEVLQAQLVDRSPEMQGTPVDESPNLQGQQQPVSGADGLLADGEIDIADVRQYLQSWGCLAHPGVRALVDGYQSSTQPFGNYGELPELPDIAPTDDWDSVLDCIKQYGMDCYQAALAAKADSSSEDQWRNLALQFDGHRMQALAWLKKLLPDLPDSPKKARAHAFLNMPPLNGETVLAKRIAALAQQDAETGKSVSVENQGVTQQNGHHCDDARHEWRQERTPCPDGQCKVRNDAEAFKYWGGKETWVRYLTDHTGLIQITARDIATCNAALDAVKNALSPGAVQQDADKVKADLLSSLVEIVGAVIASDEEGLIEHSETIIKARAAIEAARKEEA
ncbi:hypothetical protein Q9R35_00715 [Alcaligenes sp. AB3]|uniref:hypothetical protein n=1 Tax=Alcaligenes sp. AB3 TaxID=2962569 RepID=UPI0028823900|nr:hypothetical protein [Alcaligenes sp. AB3]MDT0215832.1 hypothetical protein [Alcaligenes sp. AB3]